MTIQVYSKKGCGKCEAAKDKLKIMGVPFIEHDLAYHISLHDGWRSDGSTDVMAAHTMMDTLPIFRLDDEFHDYPSAIRLLKGSSVSAAPAAGRA